MAGGRRLGSVLLALTLACGGGGSGNDASTTTDGSAMGSSTSATATTAPARRPLQLAFAGDVHGEGSIRGRLGNPHVFDPVAPLLRGADLAVVNLETAITTRGTPPAGKQYAFRAPPGLLTALRTAGTDVVSLANNHGLDYGAVGLTDTLAAAKAEPLPLIGAGTDEDTAFAPFTTELNGWKVAVIAATQVLDGNLIAAWTATATNPGLASAKRVDRLVAEVAKARRTADTVVVFLHWGVEGSTCPSADQKTLAAALVAAGADVIVGSHAHRVLGAGGLDGALVGYGLGNFAFYASDGPGTTSGVLLVTVEGRRVLGYGWAPARIRGGVPIPAVGAEADRMRAAWEALRPCTGLTAAVD